MVTMPEAHDVAIQAPWYAPTSRQVAIHRYLDAGFVAQYQADASSSPQNNPTLFGWEQEDRMPPSQGSLLKLRRPVHRTFHVVAWEACCKMPTAPSGQPAVAPEKIAEAGFVMRTGNVNAPQGFQIVQGKPSGWSAVEPKADPDAARQVKALGLVPQNATPNPGYTGEETFPLHPLAVQDGDTPHTLLYGYLPIGGGDYVPPAPATPPPPDLSDARPTICRGRSACTTAAADQSRTTASISRSCRDGSPTRRGSPWAGSCARRSARSLSAGGPGRLDDPLNAPIVRCSMRSTSMSIQRHDLRSAAA